MKRKKYSASEGMKRKGQAPYDALRPLYYANPSNQLGKCSSHSIQINEIFIGLCPEFKIK